MKEVRYFEACDGERFDNEHDCLTYEINIKLFASGIWCFDEEMNPTEEPDRIRYCYIPYADGMLEVLDEELIDGWNEVFDIPLPDESGVSYWDEWAEEWISVLKKTADLQGQLNELAEVQRRVLEAVQATKGE